MPKIRFYCLLVVLLIILQSALGCESPLGEKSSTGQRNTGVRASANRGGSKSVTGAGAQEGSKAESKFTLALAGDVLLASAVGDRIEMFGPNYPWLEVAPVLRKADLALVNLETSVATGGSPVPDKQFTFRSVPSSLKGPVWAGVDGVSLANNHVLDFGRAAWRETLQNLAQYKLAHAGSGNNDKEAMKPAVFRIKGKTVAFFAFSRVFPPGWAAAPGYAGVASAYDQGPPLKAVKEAKGKYDLIVVSVHWGQERANYPNEIQTGFGRKMIDAGADVVMGHHPHVLQGAEYYKGKVIFYSLGNFIFTSRSRITQETVIATVTFKGNRLSGVKLTPAYIEAGKTRLLSGDQEQELLKRLSRLCSPFGTKVDKNGLLR